MVITCWRTAVVIDADASGLDRAFGKRAAVIAVRLALQTLAVVRVDLGSVGNHEIAVGEAGERVELVEEHLPEALALGQDPPTHRRSEAPAREPPGWVAPGGQWRSGSAVVASGRRPNICSGSIGRPGGREPGGGSRPGALRPIESACRAGEMADAAVLKTAGGKPSSGFNSRAR